MSDSSCSQKRIVSVKPTHPGFLLVTYSDGDRYLADVKDAPFSVDILTESPTMYGPTDCLCQYCGNFLVEFYKYHFFSRIIRGRVYSYNSKDFSEKITQRICTTCNITLFAWEEKCSFVEIVHIQPQHGGKPIFARLEPIYMHPSFCPGKRNVAIGDFSLEAFCENKTICKSSGVCSQNWHVNINNSKIPLERLYDSSILQTILNHVQTSRKDC